MKVVNDPTDDVVSTEDRPVIRPGIDAKLECRECGHVFDLSDAGQDVPGGHGKYVSYTCPECDARVAKKKGTNRRFEEDYIGLTVDEAFAARYDDADDYELVVGSDVTPGDVGDTVEEVFEHYPAKGISNRLPIDDVFEDAEALRDHGAAYAAASLIPSDIPAVVEWYEGHFKPIGYPAEWEPDAEQEHAEAERDLDGVLRFVRKVEE